MLFVYGYIAIKIFTLLTHLACVQRSKAAPSVRGGADLRDDH